MYGFSTDQKGSPAVATEPVALSNVTGNEAWFVTAPDGELIAAHSTGSTVNVWNSRSGRLVAQFKVTISDNKGWFTDVAGVFAQDGGTFVAVTHRDIVTQWNVRSGRKEATFAGNAARVLTVAISPDKKLVAAGNGSDSVSLWHSASPNESRKLLHPSYVQAVAFSRSNKLLATGCRDGKIRTWQVASGLPQSEVDTHLGLITTVVFAPDEEFIVAESLDGRIVRWDISKNALTEEFTGCSCPRLNKNGRLLAVRNGEGGVIIRDLDKAKNVAKKECPKPFRLINMSFDQQDNVICILKERTHVKVWRFALEE
jgi:WD40 repeat protein